MSQNNQGTPSAHSPLPPPPLPLPQGARPLFAGRSLLESIMRSGSAGDPWSGVSHADALASASAMRICAALASECLSASRPLDPKLAEIVFKLPLSMDARQVGFWESKRPWDNPDSGLFPAARLAYADLLDSETPSEAYIASKEPGLSVWRKWLGACGSSDLIIALNASADELMLWSLRRAAGWSCPSMARWARGLGQSVGLSLDGAQAWLMFESAMASHDAIAKQAFKLLAGSKPDARAFLKALGRSLDWAEPQAGREPLSEGLAALFEPGSPLVVSGLYPLIDLGKPFPCVQGWEGAWEGLFTSMPWRAKVAKSSEDPAQALAKVAAASKLGIDCWVHAGEPLRAAMDCLGGARGRVLIWGASGHGKSELALAMACAAGLSARLPVHGVSADDAERFEDSVLAARISPSSSRSALVFEPASACARSPRAAWLRDMDSCAQIWVADSLADVSDGFLRGFGAVVECKPMPLAARVALAKSLFENEELAGRCAQALRSPADIVAAARRCEAACDWSWKCVCGMVDELSRARLAARGALAESFPIADVSGEIPSLAGNPDLTKLLANLVDAIAEPRRYAALGAKLPKGVLLLGPPGTGKTLFAKHLARSAGAPMLAPDCSALAADPSRIKALFEQAKAIAPCVVFLDEADVLLGSPSTPMGPDLERQKIVNALLGELDGVDSSEGVVVLAATHRNVRIDKAITRSGRLSMTARLRMPSKQARAEIWQAHLAGRPMGEAVDLDRLSSASCGFSGADICEAVNKAALSCAMRRSESISIADLVTACDDVFWGAPDEACVVSESEKWSTAIHEAGHAIMAWSHGFEVARVTARPRAQALGLTHWLEDEGVHTHAHGQLRGRIQMALGGLAAEKVEFGFFANGGTSDLEFAKDVMDHALGEAGFGKLLANMSGGSRELWSDARKEAFEAEERQEMESLFNAACALLESKSELLRALARELASRRELSGEELEPWRRQCGTQAEPWVRQLPRSHAVPSEVNAVEAGASSRLHQESEGGAEL